MYFGIGILSNTFATSSRQSFWYSLSGSHKTFLKESSNFIDFLQKPSQMEGFFADSSKGNKNATQLF